MADDTHLYEWTNSNEKLYERDSELSEHNSLNINQNINQLDLQEQNINELSPLDKKKEIIEENMPKSIDIFVQKQDLIRHGKYTFLNDKGLKINAKRTKPSKSYMLPVLNALSMIDNWLKQPADEFSAKSLESALKLGIMKCDTYLKKRKNPWTDEGKARYQMVSDFYKQLKTESKLFEAEIKRIQEEKLSNINSQENENTKTWYDVLRGIRTDSYTNNVNGIKITKGGGATSTLYIINNIKENKKTFFKQNENLPSEDVSVHINTQKQLLEQKIKEFEDKSAPKDLVEIYKKISSYFDLLDNHYTNNLHKNSKQMRLQMYNRDVDSSKMIFNSIYKNIESIQNVAKEISKFHDGLERQQINALNKLYTVEKDSDEYKQFQKDTDIILFKIDNSPLTYLETALDEIYKQLLATSIATTDAFIDKKAELSMRNVATSRMAKILNINSLIAESTLTNVNIDGKEMQGIMMEGAKGKMLSEINTIAKNAGKKCKYSPEAFMSLLNLQVFDIICGQIDRNGGNYMCDYKEEADAVYITKITGIDNDMSFGQLKYKTIKNLGENGLNRMRNIETNIGDADDNSFTLPAISKPLSDSILSLEKDTLKYQMCDILSKEEIDALWDRIKGIQKAIRRRQTFESKHPEIQSKFISTSLECTNAFNSFTNKIKADTVNELEADEYVKATTYFDPKYF